jgi:hypothetical protein
MLRFHTQTAGVQLTAQQPEVNLVRVTIQALAATLGGTQSLHTNSFDEALALPTEKSARLALRTQQVIAHETDVTRRSTPRRLLPDRVADRRDRGRGQAYIDRIDEMGGAVAAIEEGYQKGEIERAAYDLAKAIDARSRSSSASTASSMDEDVQPELQRIDERSGRTRSTASTRSSAPGTRRRSTRARRGPDAARDATTCSHPMRDALQARATLQEVCDVLRDEYGGYIPPDPAPRWLDVAREFTERWVHQQQIREAVGAPLLDDPRFLQPVVDVYLRSLPHVLEAQALDRAEETLVEVVLTGAVSGHWYVRREPDGWCLVPAAPSGHADVVVTLDADTVWRLGSRAITPETARSLATIEGDDALAGAILTMVAIIREP